jgi:2-polyprenyl-6-methoxyphenol hydroxylase-like FAD-dependent oxidoreductase
MDDVIIVGGGPTGFVTALGLARNGLKVRIIEAEATIPSQPRAPVYHWSVLDGLDELGVLKDCLEIGIPKQDYTWMVKRTGETIYYDLKVLEGRVKYPHNMHLGQHEMAGIVHAHLTQHQDAIVEFESRCTGLSQDSEGVTVNVEGPSGVRQLRARYVIGCDGAGSTVRKSLGVDFVGMTWPERFIATNLFYDFTKWGYSRSHMVIDDKDAAIICVISRQDLWRCTYMEDESLPIETYKDRIQAAYARILPGDQDYTLDASSPYRMHQRSAETYRKGRILLAGDAAHSTNPTGGLGLTSGLFDSYALVPALSAVLIDGADDAVLDRYSDDRKNKFEKIASPQATWNKKFVFHEPGGDAHLEEALQAFRKMSTDADFRLQRLMFTKSLESAPLIA